MLSVTAKLYVGNVSYDATGEDLSNLFTEVGTVLASRIIIDKLTGKSRGFGFVEMANEIEAEAVIDRFNGHRLNGRAILVHLAHDNRELSRRAREAKAKQRLIYQPAPVRTTEARLDPKGQNLQERIERIRAASNRTLRDRTV